MSTRSITAIVDEDGREIVVVYNQHFVEVKRISFSIKGDR